MKKVLLLIVGVVVLLSFLYLRAAFPATKEKLEDKVDICNLGNLDDWDYPKEITAQASFNDDGRAFLVVQPQSKPGDVTLYCNTYIELGLLARAAELVVEYEVNSDLDISVGLHREDGQGPYWKASKIQKVDGIEIIPLNDPIDAKINWLIAPYHKVVITLANKNEGPNLQFILHRVYLR